MQLTTCGLNQFLVISITLVLLASVVQLYRAQVQITPSENELFHDTLSEMLSNNKCETLTL